MATYSSILAWRIPWTEKPGRLQSMGLKSWTQLSDFHFHSSLQASLVAQMVKNPPAMWVNLGSIPGLGRSPGEMNSYPL